MKTLHQCRTDTQVARTHTPYLDGDPGRFGRRVRNVFFLLRSHYYRRLYAGTGLVSDHLLKGL